MLKKVKTFLAFQYPDQILLTRFNSFQERDWLPPPNSSGSSGSSSRELVGHNCDTSQCWIDKINLIRI